MHRYSSLLAFHRGFLTQAIYSQIFAHANKHAHTNAGENRVQDWFTGHLPCDIFASSAWYRILCKFLRHTHNMTTHRQAYSTWQAGWCYFIFSLKNFGYVWSMLQHVTDKLRFHILVMAESLLDSLKSLKRWFRQNVLWLFSVGASHQKHVFFGSTIILHTKLLQTNISK